MLKVYRHPDKPDVLRVVVFGDPDDEDPVAIRELDFDFEHGDDAPGVPGEWIELVDES